MRKLIFILLVLFLASCKKEVFSPSLTKEFSILSTSNGAKYNIKVALPQDYSPETQKYASIYVLDGKKDFDFVANNCSKISSDFTTSNVLVVSIGYGNNRAVDYTPLNVKTGGGAEKFMLFIKNELIPEMENEYNADSLRINRTILGHSFGGLFGVYAFANYNQIFGNYILLSPSLWYKDGLMFKLEEENRILNKNNQQLVFLGLGEMEDTVQMLVPFETFLDKLQNNYPDIKILSHLEPHQGHLGSKNPNIIEGLKFYFQNRSGITRRKAPNKG